MNIADDTGSTLASGLYTLSGQDQGQGQHGMSDDIEQDVEYVDNTSDRGGYASETAFKMENCRIDSPEDCILQGPLPDLCNSKNSLWNNVFSMCSGSSDNWDAKLEPARTMGESLTGETEPGSFPSEVPVCR